MKSGIETVLVATDMTQPARWAAEWGKALAQAHGARLVLFHALHLSPAAAQLAEESELEERCFQAKLGLDALGTLMARQGVRVETRLVEGAPGEAVAPLARAIGADLLVVGTRGLSGLRRLLLGSTATELVRRSPCPVLTISLDGSREPRPIETILAPVDFSGHSLLATECAARVAGRRHGDLLLVLLHALPLLSGGASALVEMRRAAERDLERAAALFRARGFRVETRLLDGDPAGVIQREAEAIAPDLVALGTRGLSGIKGLLLGSTARRLLQRATCPMLTYRRA